MTSIQALDQTRIVKPTKAHEKVAFWKAQIACYNESGLSRPDFCRKYSLTYSCFKYWYYRLDKTNENKAIKAIPVTIRSDDSHPNVTSTDNEIKPNVYRFIFNNGHQLVLHDANTLEQILSKVLPCNSPL